MATRPNPPDPSIVGSTRTTDRTNKEPVMLAEDLRTEAVFEVKPACTTCNGYRAQRVTIPNAVIMEQVAEPTDGLDGLKLANLTMEDERITARTASNPTPHRPGPTFTVAHLVQRAVDMKNAGLIPFSPFGSHVNGDRLRDRPLFTEWLDRYRAQTDTDPAAAAKADGDSIDELLVEVDAAVSPSMKDSYPKDGNIRAVKSWVGTNPQRAQFARAVEQQRDKPRKGVIRHADTVLES